MRVRVFACGCVCVSRRGRVPCAHCRRAGAAAAHARVLVTSPRAFKLCRFSMVEGGGRAFTFYWGRGLGEGVRESRGCCRHNKEVATAAATPSPIGPLLYLPLDGWEDWEGQESVAAAAVARGRDRGREIAAVFPSETRRHARAFAASCRRRRRRCC